MTTIRCFKLQSIAHVCLQLGHPSNAYILVDAHSSGTHLRLSSWLKEFHLSCQMQATKVCKKGIYHALSCACQHYSYVHRSQQCASNAMTV
jgi:hypothetical protein